MRVLHISSGLEGGGAEAVLYRLCTSSDARRADRVISLTTEGVHGPLLRSAGVSVRALGMPRRSLSVRGFAQLRRIIRDEKPDIVQTWMYHGDLVGGLAARLAGNRRVVWGLHNSTIDPKTTPRMTRMVVRACGLVAPVVPARIVSASVRSAEVHAAIGYPKERIAVVHYGYDASVFCPDERMREAIRKEIGVADADPLIGLVARFDPQKDVGNLLDAVAIMKGQGRTLRCLLVGAGMDIANSNLAGMIASRGIGDRMILLGRRPDVPAIMNALDVHVLSSAYGEAFPNVVAEAMACGTPCVTTDVGDAAMMVGDTGWAAPPRDSGALAAAIGAAVSATRDHESWLRRRMACVDRIRSSFSIEKMAAGYEAVWQSVLDRSQ